MVTMERVAGIKANTLDLSWCVNETAFERVDEAVAALSRISGALADSLHDAVPHADSIVRGHLLALRRALHNTRTVEREDFIAAGIDATRGSSKEYFDAAARVRDAVDDLGTAVEIDDERACRQLDSISKIPELANAIALVVPDVLTSLGSTSLAAGSRLTRTLLSYAIRAALKPSPLSSFASVGIPGVDLDRSFVRFSPSIVFAIRRAIALSRDFTDQVPLSAAPTWVDSSGETYLEARDTDLADGPLPWTPRRQIHLSVDSAIRSSVERWRDGRLSAAHVRRFIHSGVLEPRPHSDGRPIDLAALSGESSSRGGDRSKVISETLNSLQLTERRIPTMDGPDRVNYLTGVRSTVDGLFRALSAPIPNSALVHEDTGTSAVADASPAEEAVLATLRAFLRPCLFRSHVYDVLLAEFIKAHGIGASGVSALDFLRIAATTPETVREVAIAESADREWRRSGDPARSNLPVGHTTAPPTAGIIYQMTPTDADLDAVVNQFTNGSGSLYARFAHLDRSGTIMNSARRWVRELYPSIDPSSLYAVIPSLESSSLQSSVAETLPLMGWQAGAGSVPNLERTTLRHDPDHDVFEFETLGGDPVAPVHFGIVPSWMSSGVEGLALALMDPWRDGSSLTANSHPRNRYAHASSASRYQARSISGRTVIERETWILASADIPNPAAHDSPAAAMMALEAWRRREGLPVEAFAWAIGEDGFDASVRKPLWIDFHSHLCVRTLLPVLGSRQFVKFQEVLPFRSAAKTDPAGRVRERFSLVSWERPA